MKADKSGVSVFVPMDIWQSITEIRSQLDSYCPGAPTPIEEALREIILHYKGCPRAQEEMDAFCGRAKAWKHG
ncbi:MAG: hypothetical protein OK449_07845 [Thaumarchaeota archaeon]|nr:hypothetical protein [Nitrososphaerota archaeon]